MEAVPTSRTASSPTWCPRVPTEGLGATHQQALDELRDLSELVALGARLPSQGSSEQDGRQKEARFQDIILSVPRGVKGQFRDLSRHIPEVLPHTRVTIPTRVPAACTRHAQHTAHLHTSTRLHNTHTCTVLLHT
jgi:hypothetical protein